MPPSAYARGNSCPREYPVRWSKGHYVQRQSTRHCALRGKVTDVTGNLVDVPPEEARIGMPVRAVWEEVTDPESGGKLLLPQWERAT